MDGFKRIKVRKKLLLAFSVIFTMTAAVAVTGITTLIHTRSAVSYLSDYPNARYPYYADVKYQLMSLRRDIVFMVTLAGEDEVLDKQLSLSLSTVDIFIEDLEAAKDSIMSDPRMDSQTQITQIEIIDYMIADMKIFRDEHLKPFCQLMKNNEISQAEIQEEIDKAKLILNPFDDLLSVMIRTAEATIQDTQDQINVRSENMLILLITIAIVAALLSIVLAVFVSKIIAKPLIKLADTADHVASGSLSVSIDTSSHDETGIMARSLADVVDVINRFVKELHDVGYAFKVNGDTAVRINTSEYKGTYKEVASAINHILEYHVVSKNEIIRCITQIVDGDHDAPLRQFPGKEARINEAVDALRENIRKMEQIMMQKLEAEEANRAKSAFLASMSHEIRTPMNAILGVTEIMMNNSALPKEIEEGLEKIYSSCDLLLRIINDILDFSKIEAGKMIITPYQYKLSSMINDSVHLNMMRISDKPIDFEMQIDENILENLIGDELRIKQILNNLLSNAFKYTDKGKVTLVVSFESADEGMTLIFKISDTGCGMTEEQLGLLFSEYTRFSQGLSNTEGTGLGLAITYRLVSLMGGDIKAESELGKGSVFTVRLPQGVVDDVIIGRELAQNLQQFRQNYMVNRRRAQIIREPMPYGRVLIVDDVETNLYVAEGLLKLYDLQIDSVMSGIEAVEKVKGGKEYDIVFMDHMMPEMDGIETTKHMRDMGYNLPIVALTANAVTGQADMFLKNGFDEFIAKPIDIRQLNAVLNKLIRDKQSPEVIEAARAQASTRSQAAIHAREKGRNESAIKEAIEEGLLEPFLRDVRRTIGVLEELEQKGDYQAEGNLRKFVVTVHGIKSSLGNIGEAALSESAYRLEKAGREENIDLITSTVSDFLEKLRDFVRKLEVKLEANQEEQEVIREANEETGDTAASIFADKKISGLDIIRGIEKFGNDEGVYLKILRSYTAGIRSLLEKAGIVNKDNLKEYERMVHSMKGMSFDIFADSIGERAKDLERAAKAGDLDYISEHTPLFFKEVGDFNHTLEEMLRDIETQSDRPVKDKIDSNLLSDLMNASRIYDMDGVDRAITEINKYKYEADGDLADWLQENVDSMNLAEIAKKISEM